jgi:glycosyltransferase involved in cell wall biosynthesis
MPRLSIVIPLLNEQETLPALTQRLSALMDAHPSLDAEVVLVDDGSTDQTRDMVRQLALADARYRGVFLSRNFGHQLAITAGLARAMATEYVVVMDGDLQDPPELIPDMLRELEQGWDVVHCTRTDRKENWLKKTLYKSFYKLIGVVADIRLPEDTGDFCIMRRKVVDVLNQMPEESRYVRGMRAWVGFRQTGFVYERDERRAGVTKYSMRKLFTLAWTGIFNFSSAPIKFITRMGIFSILVALVYFGLVLYRKFVYNDVPQGFTATLFTIILFSGVQLFSLGIIGEYVLRIFFQVKGRPLFIVSEEVKKTEGTP